MKIIVLLILLLTWKNKFLFTGIRKVLKLLLIIIIYLLKNKFYLRSNASRNGNICFVFSQTTRCVLKTLQNKNTEKNSISNVIKGRKCIHI